MTPNRGGMNYSQLAEGVVREFTDAPMVSTEDSEALVAGLTWLAEMQRPLLEKFGHDYVDPDNMARYGLALMMEAAEFTAETPYKTWKTYPKEGDLRFEAMRARMMDEFVDLLHFVGTWVLLLRHFDIWAMDLGPAYLKKHQINQDRGNGRVEGYKIPDRS